MKLTIWPKRSGGRADAITMDVIDYEIAKEDNYPNHLHEFVVTSDDGGAVHLWLHDGRHLTKLWLDTDMARELIEELRKAIDEAADFDPDTTR